eukprot:COSAG01_NODE_24382_length_781_cov_0.997067_1_plen_56_part_01
MCSHLVCLEALRQQHRCLQLARRSCAGVPRVLLGSLMQRRCFVLEAGKLSYYKEKD